MVALCATAYDRDGRTVWVTRVQDILDGTRVDTGRRLALELFLQNADTVRVVVEGTCQIVGAFRDDYRFELVNASPRFFTK